MYSYCIAEIDREPGGWTKFNFKETFDLSLSQVEDNVERIDVRTTSIEEFQEKYEKTYIPVVLTHTQDHWQAGKKWTKHVSQFRIRGSDKRQ